MSWNGPTDIYIVNWLDRSARPQVTLVAARSHGFALRAVEEAAPGQVVQQPSVRELYWGGSDDYDAAYPIWQSGEPFKTA